MEDFKEQIKSIKKNPEIKPGDDYTGEPSGNGALQELFHTAREAALIMNEGSVDRFVKIIRIEDELMPLLLRFTNDSSGFVIITPLKFIFFVSGNNGTIYTYGLERSTENHSGNLMRNAVQLLTLQYTEKPARVEYRDNTGSSLDPQEVVFHILKWAVT